MRSGPYATDARGVESIRFAQGASSGRWIGVEYQPMRLVFIGPPGAGKGTQAKLVSSARGIPHVSTGDMLRGAMAEGSPLGDQAAEFIRAGQLVPDEIMIGIIRDRLRRPDCRNGFVLDGFPRTLAQAEALERTLADLEQSLTAVVRFVCDEETVVKRICGRRVCRACSAIYHAEASPPGKDGVCDKCAGELIQRDDDREETVRRRLKVYHKQTAPLFDYYRRAGVLHEVTCEDGIEAVAQGVERELGSVR